MKKFFITLLAAFIVMSFVASAGCCADYSGPMTKLKRGFTNIFTFLSEIPYRMKYEFKNLGPAEGLGYGFMEGMSMALLRLGVGAYEVTTFFIPMPEGYKPIIDDPEYFSNPPAVKKKK